MPFITVLAGLLLVVIGLGFGLTSEATSFTKYLPAVFGLVFVVCGAVAFRPAARKHAIHLALVVALLGALGTGMRIPTTLGQDGSAKALASQALTLLTCAGYIALGIRSFIAARKARKQAKLAEA